MKSERPGLGVFSWYLYDWANSAFSTVITTFIFATYFTQAVAPDPLVGTVQWGRTLSLAAFLVAVASPVLGAIADKGGRRKPWLLTCTLVCAIATSLMWFVKPSSDDVLLALLLVLLASVAFSFGMVFYNAMLPTLVPDQRCGRVSGWGWGLGYLGGLACLFLVLILAQGGTSWTVCLLKTPSAAEAMVFRSGTGYRPRHVRDRLSSPPFSTPRQLPWARNAPA